jgi:hypothetical protein
MHKENEYNTIRNSKLTNKEKEKKNEKTLHKPYSCSGDRGCGTGRLRGLRGRRVPVLTGVRKRDDRTGRGGRGGTFRGDHFLAFLYPRAKAGDDPEGGGQIYGGKSGRKDHHRDIFLE